jgi:hypothetical protein
MACVMPARFYLRSCRFKSTSKDSTIADEKENVLCPSLLGRLSDNPVSNGLTTAIVLKLGCVFPRLTMTQEDRLAATHCTIVTVFRQLTWFKTSFRVRDISAEQTNGQ